ncbi:eotaxin-like [Leuresthes tenuis]|uniref:eotaxin-like n=1 Tax=Leuresthes tenuis TaxID=355514 RepID=UPI003B500B3D
MKTTYILLLCILGAALFSTAVCNNANEPDNCCFEFYPRKIRKNLINSYYMTDNRCPKTAAMLCFYMKIKHFILTMTSTVPLLCLSFVTEKKRSHICVDPSLSWVKNIMEGLDKKSF